jgi:hypothetical protein
VKDLYDLTHVVDPTRPVNTVSGGIITEDYDICAMHNYEQDGEKLKAKIYNPETGELYHYFPKHMPKSRNSSGMPTVGDLATKAPFEQAKYDGTRPYFLDEFGGIKCLEANIDEEELRRDGGKLTSWGYGKAAQTKEDFYKRLESQVNALLSLSDHVWGYCYTQLTDVEQEENGIYFYDRRAKYDAARLKAIFGKNPKGVEHK